MKKETIRVGDIKRYIFYALGEIVLITLGIWIALQLDGWKENRQERAMEIKILNEIKSGFKKDIRDIQFNISLHEQSTESCQIVLDHFSRNLPYTNELSQHFSGALWYSRFIITEGPFETLKAMGLDIISNDTMRIKIIGMYDNRYEGIRLFERNTFLDESYISAVIAARFDKTEIWRIGENGVVFKGNMIPHDYQKLKSDKDYIHVLKSQISKNDFLIKWFMRRIQQDLKKLIVEIENEVDRLQSN